MTKRFISILVAMAVLFCVSQAAGAQARADSTATSHHAATANNSAGTDADNTKSNKLDPSNQDKTADDQKNDSTDLELARQIRRSVVDDKSLSTYGHNVKIVAVNGTVTLNGVARSEAEKKSIGMKAAQVAGKGHVVNEIKIEPEK
jgi:osmotically-inducible protein OsmY